MITIKGTCLTGICKDHMIEASVRAGNWFWNRFIAGSEAINDMNCISPGKFSGDFIILAE